MRTSNIPELHFFLFSLPGWMKRSRRIPFPSLELGKWSVSLLYVGRERAGQNHITSLWCCWYTVRERIDGPPKCYAKTLPLASGHILQRSVSVCMCVYVTFTRSNALNSKQMNHFVLSPYLLYTACLMKCICRWSLEYIIYTYTYIYKEWKKEA